MRTARAIWVIIPSIALAISCLPSSGALSTLVPEILQLPGIVQVASQRPGLAAGGVIWSPDSSRLAVTFSEIGEHGTTLTSLYELNIASGEINLIREVNHAFSVVAWPEDERLAISIPSYVNGEFPSGTLLMRSDGSGAPQLVSEDEVAMWSRDGRQIAIYHHEAESQPSTWSLWVRDLKSGTQHKVFEMRESFFLLDWSPDGKIMLLSRATESPSGTDLYLLDTTTSETKRLTDGGYNGGASWSPDGKLIAFTHQSSLVPEYQSALLIMRSVGDCPVELARSDAAAFEGARWSPDGRWIAFSWSEGIYLLDTTKLLGADLAEYYSSCP